MMRDPLAILRTAAEWHVQHAQDDHQRGDWVAVLYLLDQHERGNQEHDPTLDEDALSIREPAAHDLPTGVNGEGGPPPSCGADDAPDEPKDAVSRSEPAPVGSHERQEDYEREAR